MNNCGWVRNGGKCILEQEIQKYKEVIDKAIEILDNYQNNLYSKSTREFLDDDIERTITILKEVV